MEGLQYCSHDANIAARPISDSGMTLRPFLCVNGCVFVYEKGAGGESEKQNEKKCWSLEYSERRSEGKQDACANLSRWFFTDFAHSVVEEGSSAWELPAVASITQLCRDSSSSRGIEPSSSS